jgi:hypothetical protein
MGSQSLFGTQTQFPPLGAYQSPPLGAYQSSPTGALEEEEDGNDLENQLAQAIQWTNEEAVEADQPRTGRAPSAPPQEP